MKSNLKKIMSDKGVTLRGLRELTAQADDPDKPQAVSTATIANARDDHGIRTCTVGTLERIARALGCSIHDLFDDDPGQGGKDGPASYGGLQRIR